MKEEKEERGRKFFGFWLNLDLEDERTMWTRFKKLAQKGPTTISELGRNMMKEFVHRHWPGNDQTDLFNYDEKNPLPLAISARETLARKASETGKEASKPSPLWHKMTLQELRAEAKKRFLSRFDKTAIDFLIKKKEKEVRKT